MTIDKGERQYIMEEAIRAYEAKKKRELSEKMSKLGRIRSAKKRKASIRNVKIAQAVKWGRPLPKDTK
jgi:hypothetical protein